MADACSTIADKRAEWGRAHPEDDKAKVCCICSYCGEHIRESSTGTKPYVEVFVAKEELVKNRRGVWWMETPDYETWRRCYGWDVFAPGGGRMVKLKQCHRCNVEEKVLDDICTLSSDTD